MSAPKRQAAAALIRQKIASGELRSGEAAPSGAALAREAGCSVLTARAGMRILVADGTLVPGVSRSARPRIAGPGGSSPGAEALGRELSGLLADLRRSAGMTQPELAAKVQMSVTTVGHAETGRLWQSRTFWVHADEVLGGGLLELFRLYSAARAGMTSPASDKLPPPPLAPVMPVSVKITTAGVVVSWPDGTSARVLPPGLQTAE